MCEALFSESADLVVRLSYHCKRCECIANVVWMTGWTRPGKEPIKATATNCPNISCLVSAPRSSICSAVTPGPAQRSQLGCLLDTILELSTGLRDAQEGRRPEVRLFVKSRLHNYYLLRLTKDQSCHCRAPQLATFHIPFYCRG